MMIVAASIRAMGVPVQVDLADVRSTLAGRTPRAVMTAFAQTLHSVRDAGIDADAHRRFLPNLSTAVQPYAARWLDESGAPRHVLLSEQYVAIAGLIALEQSDNAGNDEASSLVAPLVAASLAVPDLLGATDLLLDVSRMVLFAESQEWSDQITVARALVRLVSAPHRTIDFDAHCRATFGIGFEEAWMMVAVFAVIGGHAAGETPPDGWPAKGQPGGYDDATLAAGRAMWTQTLFEAVQRATQDTNRLGWSFRAFVERPITVDGGDQIVVWPRAFAEKAFPFGVIALAERVATSQGIGIDIIRQECATILEEWVDSEVVEEIPHLNTIITEADQKTRFKGAGYRNKQTDWLLVEDKFVVALEARTHRPYSYKAQAVGDLSDLERDIELSIVNKIEQCDAALANAANAGLLVSRRPLAVVVNSCPVPVSPVLMHHIEARLAERKITPYRDQHPFQIAVVSAAHLHRTRPRQSSHGSQHRWHGRALAVPSGAR